jgi:glucokinase
VAADVGLPAVRLLNDLEATAWGIPHLGPDDVVTLSAGEAAPEAHRAVIAAGTGLGMCLVPFTPAGHFPVATEGGHASFAPQNEEEDALLAWLRARCGHVSTEHVVSGPGLARIYEHLAALGEPPADARIAAEIAAAEDPAEIIGPAALAGACPRSAKALDLFVGAYGAAAGSLALLAWARGGLYVGGGIAPKILPKLTEGGFLRAFTAKGRFAGFLETVPVHVITDPRTALRGAAARALGEKGV